MLNLSWKVKLYTLTIICIGLIIFSLGIQTVVVSNLIYQVIFLSFLSIISESLAIPVANSSYISVSYAIGLIAILIYPPYVSGVILSLGILLYVEYREGKIYHIFNTSIYKRLFNAGSYCISAIASGYAYILGLKIAPFLKISFFNIVGILLATLTFIISNILICTILFSLMEKKPVSKIFYQNIWIVKNFFFISPLGILMALAYSNYGWFALLLFYGPLLLARYSFKLYLDMRNVYFETIKALSKAVDAKDPYTNGHSHRVAHYSEKIASKMGLSQKSIDIVKTAAILHDIGKIGIDDHILNKPGNLTPAELAVVQQHPIIGAKILQEVDFLREVTKIIKHHHERYDGAGYPDGLKGGEIPIEAAILSVADAFDSMTSNRPYRNALPFNKALDIIYSEAGKQFNPIVVKSLKDLISENREMFINVV